MAKKDLYQEITNKIIEEMEKGSLPWQQAWDSKKGIAITMGRPINALTKRPYTKENAFYLAIIAKEFDGGKDPRFCTFNQAKKMGWSIRPGAHGCYIKQGFLATKDLMGLPLPKEDHHWTSITNIVFHASQCCVRKKVLGVDGQEQKDEKGRILYEVEDVPAYVNKIKYNDVEQIDIAENMLIRSGAVIKNDTASEAYYSIPADEIHLPVKAAFSDSVGYYATALHELGHWTGHPTRLNRDMGGGFGSERYAKEELRAEMASVFLSMDLGLPFDPTNHAAYTQSWLESLKNDKMEFHKAAGDAQKIATYIENLVKDKLHEEDKPKEYNEEGTEFVPEPVKDEKVVVQAPKPELSMTDEKIVEKKEESSLDSTKNSESETKSFLKIYQADHNCPWQFDSYDMASAANQEFKLDCYKLAFEGPVKETTLDGVYAMFNSDDRPNGKDMRSVSMSDIIELNGKAYYVDNIGFKEVSFEKTKNGDTVFKAVTDKNKAIDMNPLDKDVSIDGDTNTIDSKADLENTAVPLPLENPEQPQKDFPAAFGITLPGDVVVDINASNLRAIDDKDIPFVKVFIEQCCSSKNEPASGSLEDGYVRDIKSILAATGIVSRGNDDSSDAMVVHEVPSAGHIAALDSNFAYKALKAGKLSFMVAKAIQNRSPLAAISNPGYGKSVVKEQRKTLERSSGR